VRKELLEKRGRTVLLATNMLADAEELCDRVAIINEGRVVAVDTPANLKRKVQGVETVDLEVLTENAEALVDAVKGLDGVKACYLLRSASNPPGVASLRVLTPDSRSLLPNLIEAIHKANGKVRYVKVHEPTLEDVFIHYTGRGLCE
jgi:ABC-2 type transport system ATP-binding protein